VSAYALSPELGALAEDSDRRFRRLALILAIPALAAGAVIPFVKIASLLQEKLEQPQRYAKLIQQKPPEPKPLEDKKPEPEAKPRPQLTPEEKLERARRKAQKALSELDQLSALRDASLPTVQAAPMSAAVITSQGNTVSFASAAGQGSGGIGEVGVVEHARSTTGVGSRSATGVKSNIGGRGEGMGGKIVKGRSLEEIQLVFDRNKGAFYTMYVREQRQRPDMVGKVIVRMTIAPSGAVTRCTIVSSELNNPEFEKKVVARVLLLDFGAKDVGDFTIDYPILFFPS
jgi:periplasmic protein TonB